MSVYVKDMTMPVDCLECRIGCIYATSLVIGRPADCPLEEAKDGDLISRADAIAAVHGACVYCDTCDLKDIGCSQINALSALPSAEVVEAVHDTEWVALRRDEYEDFLASAEAVQRGW